MIREIDLRLPLEVAFDPELQRRELVKALGVAPEELWQFRLLRRSLDARQKQVVYQLRFSVGLGENLKSAEPFQLQLQNVANKPPVIVVGFGPAGMFAALRLIELGFCPIVLERGKEVRERRFDIAALNKRGEVNPESNYCFGEGGAGTFSDGKLYTRAKKRGEIKRVLEILVYYGADPEILINTHPHIGSNKLPQVVQNIRAAILECGGQIQFSRKVEKFLIGERRIQGVLAADGEKILAPAVILATGHSARDIFATLVQQKIAIEQKELALGVRVEHPQALINKIQYRSEQANPKLPAAAYSYVEQAGGAGVFSFCMCPGGIICPSATESNQVVVNGWSPSKRNSYFANSGIVTEISSRELSALGYRGALAAVEFQEFLETTAWTAGGGRQVAPAQRLTDFVSGRPSQTLGRSSYHPGIAASDLRQVFPEKIYQRLRDGFLAIAAKAKGYLSEEALVLGVETRTSSPVRIPRDKYSRMHPEVLGLFPSGEGGGYAGGIMSAAMDGENSAQAVAAFLTSSVY